MIIIVRDEAERDLDEIFDWIEKDSPTAAIQVVRRIRAKLNLLLTPGMADMGRPGRDPGTRELIEGPYIIVYEVGVAREEIVVLAVFHGAQDR